MSQIIDAKDRFSARASQEPSERERLSLEEVLRGKRVPHKDRPILAERLGELAARLDPARPKDGARKLFRKAWGDEKWDKRKRLLRLPDELASEPLDHGAYEASGATWAAIIRAAGELLYSSGDQHVVIRERERLTRDTLRGTSFLPRELDLPVETEGARELIDLMANRITVRIAEQTRLQALWAILKAAPFTIEIVWEEDNWPDELPKRALEGDERSTGPLAAPALLASTIFPPDWRGKRRFTHDVRSNDWHTLSWANPGLKIGALAKRHHIRIFRVPEHLRAAFSELECGRLEGDSPGPHDAAISAWFTEIGDPRYRNLSWDRLPDQQYDESCDYGWQSFAIETVRSVWLEVREKPDGSPGVWMFFDDDDSWNIFPVVDRHDICRYAVQTGKFGEFDGLPDSITRISEWLLRWPAWIEELCLPTAPEPGGVIGLVECPNNDWYGEENDDLAEVNSPDGWIDDADNKELVARIFARSSDIRFIPLISAEWNVPLPCAAETIVGALIANARAPEEARLPRLLVDKARAIADAGLEYHNAVVAYHRAIIEAM